jgi:hypothetical protein
MCTTGGFTNTALVVWKRYSKKYKRITNSAKRLWFAKDSRTFASFCFLKCKHDNIIIDVKIEILQKVKVTETKNDGDLGNATPPVLR